MNEITVIGIVIIAVTISVLFYLYKTKCKHKWKIVNEQERVHTITTSNNRTYENKYPCYLMQCEKCGKLFFTKDPNETNGKIM